MGLDMYLKGRKDLYHDWDDPQKDRKEDGLRITQIEVELGYWRKHPNLHGYIVKHFADGVDECQDIELSGNALRQIVQAVKDSSLPHTEGFFFGSSNMSQQQRDKDIEVLEHALAWLERVKTPKEPEKVTDVPGMVIYKLDADDVTHEIRSVVYRASW